LADDLAERQAFRQLQGDYLPSDIWAGLMDAPPQYAIVPVRGNGGVAGGIGGANGGGGGGIGGIGDIGDIGGGGGGGGIGGEAAPVVIPDIPRSVLEQASRRQNRRL
jgi:hypothetical protein